MRSRIAPARQVTALVAATLLASTACSAAAPAGSGPSASQTSTPTAPATTGASPSTVTTNPSPTPIAVLDGEPWIVYQWAPQHGRGLYLMRPDGSDSHEIAPELTGEAGGPDWSPDGERIAFELMVDDNVFEIWTVKADGTDPQMLLACEAAPCVQVGVPAWSPDGKQLAFGRLVNPTGNYQDDRLTIEVLDLATRESRVIAIAPAAGAEAVEYVNARWSPDGKQVVFTINRYATPPTNESLLGSSIAVVKTDGSEVNSPRFLTDAAMFGSHPDWSPDGKRIVFNTHGLGFDADWAKASNLYTINPDGTGLTQVTRFGDNDTRVGTPSWTPDGTQILFTHTLRNASNPDGDRHAAFIHPDGSNLTVLSEAYATHPRLRPTP
jgi:Tol biopolymer transport system component